MGSLFRNEWLKLKYNKTIWLFWGMGIVLVALMGMLNAERDLEMNLYGYTASFAYMRMAGTFVVMLLAPVAGAVFTQEFKQGTMHNTLSCGVSRLQYFAVKAVCVFAADLAMFLLCLAEYVCVRTAVKGWVPGSQAAYPDYGLASLAFQSGTILLLCAYIALFILVAVSVRKPAIVYLSGAAAVMGEIALMNYAPGYRGVIPAVIHMYDMAAEGRVLTPEFAGLFFQGAVMGIAFLALAVLIFLKRDIN